MRPVLERLRVASSPHPPAAAAKTPQPLPLARRSNADLGWLGRPEMPSSADLFRWLFSGTLAHPGGGIAGWRERETGRLSDEYPEITGYFLSAAVFAGATDSEAVIGAADWLAARIEA